MTHELVFRLVVGEPLEARVAELPWYHTLELGDGVVTPGFVDNRSAPARLPFPDLEGKRCLDVGTMNGFWAFELERRGAAEVVALDIDDATELDWPARQRLERPDGSYADHFDRASTIEAFQLAREALGSKVKRHVQLIYELSPETVGEFDFVFLGSILLHLRDPVLALEKVREVCRGQALVFDTVDITSSVVRRRKPRATLNGTRVWWWTPNVAGLRRMAASAGWELEDETRIMGVPGGAGFNNRRLKAVLKGPTEAFSTIWGAPHVGLLLRPIT